MQEDNVYDPQPLRLQIALQKKHAWDLEKGIQWDLSVDPNRFLFPLDQVKFRFPKADHKQQLALSQLFGLVSNWFISEFENIAVHLRKVALEQILRAHPRPEILELGELFFAEEQKHMLALSRYNEIFCKKMGVLPEMMENLFPLAYRSLLFKTLSFNARLGGNALWWVAIKFEKNSLDFFKEIQKNKNETDPLFYDLHLRHMQEESRHSSYAFLVLKLIENSQPKRKQLFYKTMDFLILKLLATVWGIIEFSMVFEAKKYRNEHPFFETAASCIPLLKNFHTAKFITYVLHFCFGRGVDKDGVPLFCDRRLSVQ